MSDRQPRVLILGAGFGGLWAARALAGEPVQVTLVDRHNFHTFFPLLYQIGAAELEAVAIAYPVRGILRKQRNVRFRMAEVRHVDLEARVVSGDRGSWEYDCLILAIGSVTDFFGVAGASEHAFPLRVLEEGLALRNHILSRFEKAIQEPDRERRQRALRFVIVGGGPTGVEFAGALAELVSRPLAKDYPELAPDVSVMLLEAQDRLFGAMPEALGRYAEKRLRRMGVDVRFGAAVERVEPHAVHLGDGTAIPTETVTWTAGVRGDPVTDRWGLPTGPQGRVPVTPSLQLEGRPEVYAIGDLAWLASDGEPLPMLAPVAIQQGEHAAANLLRSLRGEEPTPFRYKDRGILATIGRNAAVADVFGRRFTGFTAWFLWLAIHIAKLIGFRNRLVTLINWAWDYLFFERAVRLILPFRAATQLESTRAASRDPPPS